MRAVLTILITISGMVILCVGLTLWFEGEAIRPMLNILFVAKVLLLSGLISITTGSYMLAFDKRKE
jgi:hypothetical protein